MNVCVILPAAGSGKRFGGLAEDGRSKIEQDLQGRPVFQRAIELFSKRDDVGQIILAVSPDQFDAFKLRQGDRLGLLGVTVVKGGEKERWETVQAALAKVDPDCTHVAVHDAARPLTPVAMIDRVFEAAASYNAVIPALPVSNTLKRVTDPPAQMVQGASAGDPVAAILGADQAGPPPVKLITETVPRRDLVQVQTPQVFQRTLLEQAYQQIADGKLDPQDITDDASLVEAMGKPVFTVMGDVTNLKVTVPADLHLARLLCRDMTRKQSADLGVKRLFGEEA